MVCCFSVVMLLLSIGVLLLSWCVDVVAVSCGCLVGMLLSLVVLWYCARLVLVSLCCCCHVVVLFLCCCIVHVLLCKGVVVKVSCCCLGV